jgi:hypothetical protein
MSNASSASLSSLPMSFLQKVLWADAALSALSGLSMALGGVPLQGVLGLPAAMVVPGGLGLLAYAVFLAWVATRPVLPRGAVMAAVIFNLVWTVDCLAIAFGPWFSPTALGQVFLLANVVAGIAFAELQVIGLRRR